MFQSLLLAVLDNAIAATILAILVYAVTRVWRNAAVRHALWLLVLLKLVAPPILGLPFGPAVSNRLGGALLQDVSPRRIDREIADHGVQIAMGDATLRAVALPNQMEKRNVSAAVPSDAARRELSVAAVVCGVWLAVAAAWLGIAAVRIARFHRAVERAEPAPQFLQLLLHQVSERLCYRGSLELRLSEGRFPPLVWALGRPKIVLSRQLAQQLSAVELSGILAHEIAHLLRRDHWVRWLELIVFAFAWWHPVAWWARIQLREAEEEACDARVVASWEGSAEWYVHALLTAIDCASDAEGRVPSLASGLGRGSLTRRVKAMVNRNVAWQMGKRNWVIVGLTGAFVLPLSVLSVRAETAGSTKSPAAVTLAELRDGIQKMEQRIRTLSVNGESETENHFRNAAGKAPAKGIIENNAVDLLKRISSSWVVDSTGRTWQKHSTRITTMTSDNTRINNEEDLEAVFDGKQGRTLKIVHLPGGNHVLVDKTRTRWNYHIWSPLYYTIWHIDGPVSQILSPPDARIVGTETWESRAVVVAEAGLPRPPSVKQEYKTQIWVDPARNFVIVRRRVFARYAKDRPWHLHLEIASFELEEASPGIWLPERVEMKNFAVPPAEPKDLDLLVSREKIQYREWKVNEKVPDAKFQMDAIIDGRMESDDRMVPLPPPIAAAPGNPDPFVLPAAPVAPGARQPGTLRPAD